MNKNVEKIAQFNKKKSIFAAKTDKIGFFYNEIHHISL